MMLQQTPSPAPTPAAPGTFTYTATPDGRLTAADVRGLQSRLESLRSQLQDVASRRRTVSEQLRNADEAARPGLERRLRLQDERIEDLERQITATTQQLAAAPPAVMAEAIPPSQPFDVQRLADSLGDQIVPIVAMITLFVLFPFSLGLGRFFWKRATGAARPVVTDARTQQQLEHLQRSVDTIAIEVERISEGQRFVTRIMNERGQGSGALRSGDS